ncbi:MAG: hypothetical protein QXF35_00230 [Candidatus Bilamarchaeaceae archaeon]
MNFKNFKGQAMIEYLTTYGWAIFILAVVIGILLFGGFFRSDFFISEKCELGSNIPCKAVVYNDRAGITKVSIEVLNAFSYPIEISDFSLILSDGSKVALSSQQKSVESGSKLVFNGAFPQEKKLEENALKQFSLYLQYRSCAPELRDDPQSAACSGDEHTISGRLVAKVVAPD